MQEYPKDWKTFVIGKNGWLLRDSVSPSASPHEMFVEYSMPAFDGGKGPAHVLGRTMRSARNRISGEVLLFNKLNVRKRRVWHVEKCEPNAVASGEFLAYQSNELDLSLLRQVLITDPVTAAFCEVSTGTSNSQKRIRPSAFLDFEVALPSSLAEQRRIATALNSMDQLINSLEKRIEKKKLIKNGAMHDLLTGEIRLRGFSGAWSEQSLGKYVNCLRGVSYDGERDLSLVENDDTIRLLRSNNIQDACFVDEDVQYVNRARASTEQVLKPYDIMVCMANGSKDLVGKTCLFKKPFETQYTFGAFMGCIRAKERNTNMEYVFQLMNSYSYSQQIAQTLAGSSINNLRPSNVLGMKFAMPVDACERDAIARVLGSMDEAIALMEMRVAKLRLIKKGMLQDLLTGRVRLKEGKHD